MWGGRLKSLNLLPVPLLRPSHHHSRSHYHPVSQLVQAGMICLQQRTNQLTGSLLHRPLGLGCHFTSLHFLLLSVSVPASQVLVLVLVHTVPEFCLRPAEGPCDCVQVFSRPYTPDADGTCRQPLTEYVVDDYNLCCSKCPPGNDHFLFILCQISTQTETDQSRDNKHRVGDQSRAAQKEYCIYNFISLCSSEWYFVLKTNCFH